MGIRKGKNFIFWVDLECTGSGDEEDIVELGAVITDKGLNELDARSYILPTTPEKYEGMKEVVVNMHNASGLLPQIRQTSEMGRDMELAQVDSELEQWIRSFAGGDHVPIAGSGVAHYDRKFIKRDLPLLDKRLTYYHLDIGSVRRFVDLVGLEWPEFHMSKTHRALDDARQHLEEARRFLAWCEKAKWKAGIRL